jgi:hypothetical protein
MTKVIIAVLGLDISLLRKKNYVKSILSLLLLFSFLIVSMSKSIIFVNYEINKTEITAKYCINKDKPQMHCCGKCLLKKKLAEQEANQNFPTFPDIKTDIQLFCSESFDFLNFPEIRNHNIAPANLNLHSQFEGMSVFHPPGC